MKYFKINTGLFCSLILSFYILRFACSNFMENIFLIYLIPTFWVTAFIYLKSNNPFENRLNIRRTYESFLFIIIIITVYFLINFVLGLFLSYSKNPYSPKALLYLWEYVFFIFFQEYVRFLLISNNKDNFPKVVAIITLFIFIEIQPTYFVNNFQSEKVIEYIIYILIPIILENLIFAYFAKLYDSGYVLSFIYKIYMGLYTYAMPIYPNLRKDSILLLRIMLILIIFFKTAITNKKETGIAGIISNKNHVRKWQQKGHKRNNHIFYSIVFSISLITIIFVSGITGYFPIAITSGSMQSSIKIGDIVIVEKLDSERKSSILKEGDVIVYKLNDILVVHRIVKIGSSPINSEKYYITKGDNNFKPDKAKVYSNQVIGSAKYKMPYLGYPSILARKYLSAI